MSACGKHGGPHFFRCTNCRRTRMPWPAGGSLHVTLTSRTKPARAGYRSARASGTLREYECQDCGYKGWSQHTDLARKAEALGKP